jgi:hypothetical protein
MRKFSAAMLAAAISFSGAEASASVMSSLDKSTIIQGDQSGEPKDWLEPTPALRHMMAFATNLEEPELQTGAPRVHLAIYGVCISSRGGAIMVC